MCKGLVMQLISFKEFASHALVDLVEMQSVAQNKKKKDKTDDLAQIESFVWQNLVALSSSRKRAAKNTVKHTARKDGKAH